MGVRTYPNVPRVYFDLDGTLFDFVRAATAKGLTPKEYKVQRGAFSNLPLIAGAQEAVAQVELMGYQSWVLSKISKSNPYAAAEKLIDVRQSFPSIGDRVIISPDKGAVGTARDFLVDDLPEWANANNFPGTVLRFENNWAPILDALRAKQGLAAGSALREPCDYCQGNRQIPSGIAWRLCPSCEGRCAAPKGAL